jgi:hypothetical protein
MLVTIVPANSVAAVMAFDFARMFNPLEVKRRVLRSEMTQV